MTAIPKSDYSRTPSIVVKTQLERDCKKAVYNGVSYIKSLFISNFDLELRSLTQRISTLSVQDNHKDPKQLAIHEIYPLTKINPGFRETQIQDNFFITLPDVLKGLILDYVNVYPLVIELIRNELPVPSLLKNITALSLYEVSITSNELTQLFRFCNHLQSLRITNYVSLNWVRIVAEGCPNLTHLDLSYNLGITDNCLKLVIEKLKQLQYLKLTDSEKITDNTLFLITEHLKGLKHLDLSGCNSITLKGILKIIEELTNLQFLAIPITKDVTDDVLDIMVKKIPNLCYLGLHAGKHIATTITNKGIERVIEGFPKLQDFSLVNIQCVNSLTLIKIAVTLTNLQYLEIEDCHKIGMVGIYEMAKRLKNLQYLDISNCTRIPNEGYKMIAYGFSSLRQLRLSTQNEGFDEVIETITNAHPNLDYLELPYCKNLSDIGVDHITRNCRNLKHLNLHFCFQVTNKGLSYIEERLPLLSYLNVKRTTLSKRKILSIKTKVERVVSDW